MAETIEQVCECGRTYKVPRSHIGRKIQCRKCGRVIRVEEEEAEPAPFSMALVSMEDTGLLDELGPLGDDGFDDDDEDTDPGLIEDSTGVTEIPSLERPTIRTPAYQAPLPLPKTKTKSKSRKKRKTKTGRKTTVGREVALSFDTPDTEDLMPDLSRPCPECAADCPDDAAICTTCGYDFEAGQRLGIAAKGDVDPQQRKALHGANDFLKGLERWGWLSLTPLGIALGPMVLLRSLGAGAVSRGLRKKARAAFNASMLQVRLVALVATALWVSAGAYGLSQLNSDDRPVRLRDDSARVRAELTALAAAVRQVISSAEGFPSAEGMSATQAIRELSRDLPANLDASALARDYTGRFLERVTSSTDGKRWLFWQRPQANLQQIVVVRFDKSLEVYDREDFSTALQRAFTAAPDAGPTEPNPGAGPQDPTSRFLNFMAEAKAGTSLEAFEQALGQQGLPFLTRTMRSSELKLREAVLDATRKLDIPDSERVRLARIARRDSDEAFRLKVLERLRELNDPVWIEEAGRLFAKSSDSELRIKLQDLLIAAAAESPESLKAVITVAAQQRESPEGLALLILPSELFPNLLPLLYEDKLYDEVRAILSADQAKAIAVISEAKPSSPQAEKLLGALLGFPFYDDEEPVLDLIARLLQDRGISVPARDVAIRGMARFRSPKSVRLAAQQLSFDPRELRFAVQAVFDQAAGTRDGLLELIRALESEDAGPIAKQTLKRNISPEILEVLALEAKNIQTTTGQVTLLDFIVDRNDPAAISILEVFQTIEDPQVKARIFDILNGLPKDPLDSRLAALVEASAVELISRPERNDPKKIAACDLLTVYQSSKGLRALERLVEKTDSVPAARGAIRAISRHYDYSTVKLLTEIEANEKLNTAVRKEADSVLRTITKVSPSPNWKEAIKERRREILTNLEILEASRKDSNEALHERAEAYRKRNSS